MILSLIILSLIILILIYRDTQRSKQLDLANHRITRLEADIVIHLEDRISKNEESIHILEHAYTVNTNVKNTNTQEEA